MKVQRCTPNQWGHWLKLTPRGSAMNCVPYALKVCKFAGMQYRNRSCSGSAAQDELAGRPTCAPPLQQCSEPAHTRVGRPASSCTRAERCGRVAQQCYNSIYYYKCAFCRTAEELIPQQQVGRRIGAGAVGLTDHGPTPSVPPDRLVQHTLAATPTMPFSDRPSVLSSSERSLSLNHAADLVRLCFGWRRGSSLAATKSAEKRFEGRGKT
jgi:hypothetical protein